MILRIQMKKSFFIFLVFTSFFIQMKAQFYDTGIGARFGTAYGLSVKHFFSEKVAIEGLAVRRQKGYRGILLLEGHFEIVDQTSFFIGLGGHAGYREIGLEGNTIFIAGIDGILGLEYTFDRAPFSLSVDVKPHYELVNLTDLFVQNAAFTLRYVF